MNNHLSKTPLDYLMKLTQVTGKELSNRLHVDMSLVSRWKNGERKLSFHSEHLQNVCDFFIWDHEGIHLPIINRILKLDETYEKMKANEIIFNNFKEHLQQWLITPLEIEQMTQKHTRIYMTFNGYEGHQEAMNYMLEDLVDSEQIYHLYYCLQDELDWLVKDEQYSLQWIEKISKLLTKGSEFYIVIKDEIRLDDYLSGMILLMPLFLTGQAKLLLYKHANRYNDSRTIFYIEDKYIMTRLSYGNSYTESLIELTNDQIVNDSYKCFFYNIMIDAQPLLHRYTENMINHIFDEVINAGENCDCSYLLSNELFFSNMSEDLIKEILNDNGCSELEKEKVVKFYMKLNYNFCQNVRIFRNQHVYNYSSLEKLVMDESGISGHLSMIVGRKITFSKKHVISHIKDTIKRLKCNRDFHVAISTDKSHLSLAMGMDIWIKDGHLVSLWPNKTYNVMLMGREPLIVQLFTTYFEQLWNKLSSVEKDKKLVIKKLEKLIQLAIAITEL